MKPLRALKDGWDRAGELIGTDGCTWALDLFPRCCWAHDWRWRHSPPRRTWAGIKWKARSDVAFGKCHIEDGWRETRKAWNHGCRFCALTKGIFYLGLIAPAYTVAVATFGWFPWLAGNPDKPPPGTDPWGGVSPRDYREG